MTSNEAVEAAVSTLYETTLDASRWPAAMEALARAFDAPMSVHWRFDFNAGTATEFRGHGHDPSVQANYTRHFHKLDPGIPAVFGATVGRWYGDEALYDRRARDQQEYTVDFAIPSDIGWVGGGKLAAPSPNAGLWFGVQRHFDAKPFGAEGARLFESLAPHLQRADRIRARLEKLAFGHTLAQATLDTFKSAVWVVDAKRGIRLANAAAESMLRAGGALGTRDGRILLSPGSLDSQLHACLTSACSRAPRTGAFPIPRATSLLPLQVIVLPIPHRHDLSLDSREPLAPLIAADPEMPHLASEAYQALFRLSPAEAALLQALVNGSTVAAWAELREVSMSTARTQLNAVFAKTGADSQARLIRIAKTLPAVE